MKNFITNIEEYKGFRIAHVTRKDWIVLDANDKYIYTDEGRIPKTKKEAKKVIDDRIERLEFMWNAFPKMIVDIDDSTSIENIIKAVEDEFTEWKFYGTEEHTDAMGTHTVAVFERRF